MSSECEEYLQTFNFLGCIYACESLNDLVSKGELSEPASGSASLTANFIHSKVDAGGPSVLSNGVRYRVECLWF